MIRSIIVDDELFAREGLVNLLAAHCPDVEVVAKADSVDSATEAIRKHLPDLVFLDIGLTDGTGFDVLLRMERIDFHTIFVTVHEEKAVMAFRFSATDYLVKPVNIKDLKDAVEKVRQDMKRETETANIKALLDIISADKNRHDIVNIPGTDGFRILHLDEILTCEADGFCTIFHLKGSSRVISSKNLKYYEEMLAPRGFMRVHHSFMVNVKHVTGYSSDGVISLIEGQRADLGNSYKKAFQEMFARFK